MKKWTIWDETFTPDVDTGRGPGRGRGRTARYNLDIQYLQRDGIEIDSDAVIGQTRFSILDST